MIRRYVSLFCLLLLMLSTTHQSTVFAADAQKKVVASYFAEWSVYDRNFPVSAIPAEKLTHVLYAFIAVCGPNESLRVANPSGHAILLGECADQEDYSVSIYDRWAALDKAYPGDSWDDPIKGNFGELKRLKAKHPHLKVLPSIGGWTLSDPFHGLALDPVLRKRFVKSAIDFLRSYTMFDGLDIDWEYPGGGGANAALGQNEEGKAYAALMAELRVGLNALSQETGRSYELTSAVGADPSKIKSVDYQNATSHMDYIFAMTYDFYGAWNGTLGHHAGLYKSAVSVIEGFNASDAIDNLLKAGVPKEKLVLGFAMYGRGWQGVSGATAGEPMSGTGLAAMAGTWEPGVLDYKDIEKKYFDAETRRGKAGFEYYYDAQAEAPYLYNPTRKELITFEDETSVRAKADFAEEKGLAGVFSWEIDADSGRLLKAATED